MQLSANYGYYTQQFEKVFLKRCMFGIA